MLGIEAVRKFVIGRSERDASLERSMRTRLQTTLCIAANC